jgi:hypothetical protein
MMIYFTVYESSEMVQHFRIQMNISTLINCYIVSVIGHRGFEDM